MLQTHCQIEIDRRGEFSRRSLIGGIAGTSLMGLFGLGGLNAEELKKSGKSIILLWMDGGPSQFETFNPKIGSKNQGPAQAISTKVPGIQFAEFWPKTAQINDEFALIRSMVSKEVEHDRAISLVRTGYSPAVSIRYPTWGSVVSRFVEDPTYELPSFVRIGKPRIATRDVDSGVLGSRYSSFNIDVPGQLPPNVQPALSPSVLSRRVALTQRLDEQFSQNGGEREVKEKQDAYNRALRLMQGSKLGVFDLSDEADSVRDAYGRTPFGQGCLLARRLVESGVSFVEVISGGNRKDAGWDTHTLGFEDIPYLCQEVDQPYASLLSDLKQRGLLENTLVVWMGEFGRTPKLKTDGGRDHYAKGWITCLAGCGVKGGLTLGATDANGIDVTERPVGIPDLFVTFCHVLGMDPKEEYHTFDNRPIKLVEGGEVIRELFA